MDNLRVVLTVLIVFQHASFAYATANWWYFIDVKQQPLLASFFIVNRSFRMSLFFLIAGYFMPYVLDRKGARVYLKDRFRRFGIPLLVFLVVVIPPLMYAYFLNFRPYGPIGFFDYYIHYYWGIGRLSPDDWSGPAWLRPSVRPPLVPRNAADLCRDLCGLALPAPSFAYCLA